MSSTNYIPPKWQEIGLSNHAMLIAWGQFAGQIGLIETMMQVKMKQKTRVHRPQKKVLEFLVAILAGYAYLKDISRSAHPLDQDEVVANAWKQESWADYSGVSRTLQTISEAEANGFIEGLEAVSDQFMQTEIMSSLQENGRLVYDGDLTGRPVSSTSQSYPEVAFGRMGDRIELGYQAAVVSLESPTFGRLWLSNRLHPGSTVSVTEAQEMVRQAEQRTGLRPRRRLELVQIRLQKVNQQLQVAQTKEKESQVFLAQLEAEIAGLPAHIQEAQEQVAQLQQHFVQKGKPERPYSQLAKARRRLAMFQKRLRLRQQALPVAQKRVQLRTRQREAALADWLTLEQHAAQLETDNLANTQPIAATFRLDAGFSSNDNLCWLIEMGYDVLTKPRATSLADKLLALVTAETTWQPVGRNACMTTWSSLHLPDLFDYPLDMALLRYQQGNKQAYASLLYFGSSPLWLQSHRWFHDYNARQSIEAGIKEGKNVFQMHHLKVRSFQALRLQEHFAAFAANFVRWADLWLAQQQPSPTHFPHSIKQLVQVASHTSALVYRHGGMWLLMFTRHSCYAGLILQFGNCSFQLPLPFWSKNVQNFHF
jgi:hypothetical protein